MSIDTKFNEKIKIDNFSGEINENVAEKFLKFVK
jgi:hypothetical protein